MKKSAVRLPILFAALLVGSGCLLAAEKPAHPGNPSGVGAAASRLSPAKGNSAPLNPVATVPVAAGPVSPLIANDSADALRAEALALRPKLIRFGPPFELANLTSKAKTLREKVETYTQSHTGKMLNRDWQIAVETSFELSSITEWNSQPLAEKALRDQWQILAHCQPVGSNAVADVAIRMVTYHLRSWAASEPEKSIALADETDKQFGAALSQSARRDWEWWKDKLKEHIESVAEALPPPRQAKVRSWVTRTRSNYWMNAAIPVADRTQSVAWHARKLYGQGDVGEAAALLDGWSRKHGEKVASLEFLNVRFFVAYLGAGDRPTAQRMIQAATALVEKKAASEKDDLFVMMTKAWYARLTMTDDQLRQEAHARNIEKKAKRRPA